MRPDLPAPARRCYMPTMTLSGLLVFSGVYALAVATPGPGVTAIVARVISRGLPGIGAFIGGFVVGDLVWFAFALAGLSALAEAHPQVFLVLRWIGVAYLCWLGFKLWTAPATPMEIAAVEATPEPRLRLFLAGLALTLGNPKVMLFFLAILPTVVNLGGLDLASVALLWVLCGVILTTVLGGWALLARQARRLITSPRARRIVDRACGTAMVGAAAAIATR